jgi:hypothetical protein
LLAVILSVIFIAATVEFFLRIDGRYLLYHEKNNQPFFSQFAERANPEHIFRYGGIDSFALPKKRVSLKCQ